MTVVSPFTAPPGSRLVFDVEHGSRRTYVVQDWRMFEAIGLVPIFQDDAVQVPTVLTMGLHKHKLVKILGPDA